MRVGREGEKMSEDEENRRKNMAEKITNPGECADVVKL